MLHLTCGSPDSLSCPAGWTVFSSHHPRLSQLSWEGHLPTLTPRSLLQLTASLSNVFRLLPPISPCSLGLSNEEHLCPCHPPTWQSLCCLLSLMHNTNAPGACKGGERWEPPFSLSSLARSNLPRLLVRNQSYRKAAQSFFHPNGYFSFNELLLIFIHIAALWKTC